MKILLKFTQLIVILIFLSSCRTSINNKEYPKNDSENNKNNEKINSEKKRMEIKFSCDDDGLSEYLAKGWVILEEKSQEKICTWKSVPATEDCDMEKDKGCKITMPDKVGEEKIYILEK